MRGVLYLLTLVLAVSLLVMVEPQQSVLRGDLTTYAERTDAILSGRLPYVDTVFEHLPLSLVPLLLSAWIASLLPSVGFNTGLILMNVAALVAVVVMVGRLGELLGVRQAQTRWLLVAAPLFPIVLFRLDPPALALGTLGMLGLVMGHRAIAVLGTGLGIAFRGWPIALLPAMWRRGWRMAVAVLGGLTAAMAALLAAAPGFVEGRAFEGVHIETFSGSILLATRHATGTPLGAFGAAGATYIAAEPWMVLLQVALGLAIAAAALLRFGDDLPRTATLLTFGLILGAPLLSAQFLLWPTVFLALTRRAPTTLAAIVGAITTTSLLFWQPLEGWWSALLLTRNLVLAAVVVLLLVPPGRDDALLPQPATSSRRNLPV